MVALPDASSPDTFKCIHLSLVAGGPMTESLRLENEMYHRWRKVAIILSIVIVVALPALGLGVYVLMDLPIMLVLVPSDSYAPSSRSC
jgi:hypothetical protein